MLCLVSINATRMCGNCVNDMWVNRTGSSSHHSVKLL